VTHKEVLTFIGCGGFGDPVAISTAHLELNANGSAKLEKRVILTPEGSGCEVLIEPQTLENFSYTNQTGGKVTVEPKVSKIHSRGTGGVCGGENTDDVTGRSDKRYRHIDRGGGPIRRPPRHPGPPGRTGTVAATAG
jgi:hypothetical protein